MSVIGKISLTVCLLLFGLGLIKNAEAQVFGDETNVPARAPAASPSSVNTNSTWSNPRRAPVAQRPIQAQAQPQTTSQNASPTPVSSAAAVEEENALSGTVDDFFIPLPKVYTEDRPTLDGVKRGRVSLNAIMTDGDVRKISKDDELIFLYYRDFKIGNMMSGMVSCDVTFVVLTTLNRRLSNISYKLQWPDMGTSISFDNVAPNTETVISYTLLGEGCYSMDKIPNVVVNRCRVKGLTQQQCAGKIRWVRK